MFSEIERNIAEAEQQIAQYREELQESREIRRHRQEYDALAQVREGRGRRRGGELGEAGGRRGGKKAEIVRQRFIKCRCTCRQLPRSHNTKFSHHRFFFFAGLVSVV